MTTYTTKQVRENMPQLIRELQSGKAVQITYRRKPVAIMQPLQNGQIPLRRGSPQAISQFLATADFGPIPDEVRNSRLTIKQEIAELRNRDLEA